MRENDIDFQPDELGCKLAKAFATPFRPTIFNRNGASISPAEFGQPLHKSSGPLDLLCRRARAQEPDGRQLPWLLRARHYRPRRSRAAEQRYELSPFQFIEPHPVPSARVSLQDTSL